MYIFIKYRNNYRFLSWNIVEVSFVKAAIKYLIVQARCEHKGPPRAQKFIFYSLLLFV